MRLVPANAAVTRRRKAARPPRAVSAATAVAAVAALATGCQAGGGSASPAAGTVSLSVAAIQGVDDAPLYVAEKNGIFKAAGLDVTITSYPSVSKELQALTSGRVDVAAGDYADFFYAEATARHPDLRIVADGYHAAPGVMEVLARPDSGITTPQDLAGKIIGTSEPQVIKVKPGTPYSLDTIATESVLQNDGVNPAKVTWKAMPSADLINALSDHHVDAILVQEPYILDAESRLGAIEVLDSCSGATASLPLTGYFATGSVAKTNLHALQEFRSALEQAQADAVLPGPVHAVLARYPGMSVQAANLITIGAYPTTLDAASLDRVTALMFSFGVLVSTLDVTPMVIP